jgi:predicted metal-binding protein
MQGMPEKTALLSRQTPWRDVVIVCRKCGKKLDGGFGAKRRESLKVMLRQAIRDMGRRRTLRVFEVSCMGICPKQGVTALNATSPGTIHVIPAGTAGQAALRTLLGDHAGAGMDGVETT